MGHYSDCYEAEDERRRKEIEKTLRADIAKMVKDIESNDDLYTVSLLLRNINVVKGMADLFKKLSKETYAG